MDRKQTTLNIATGYLTLATQVVTNFFLSSFVVAHIGEEANGFIQLASNFVTYASLLTMAFNSMGSRFMSYAFHRKESEKTNRYYSTMIVCNLLSIFVLLPLASIVIANLGEIVDTGNSNLADIQLLFSCVFANFFFNLIVSSFFAATFVTNHMTYQNIVDLMRNILNAILLLCVFSFFEARVYFVSLIALSLTITILPISFAIRKRLMPHLAFSFSKFSSKSVLELLSSGIWNTINQCGILLMTGLDLLLANWFVGAAAMGLLSVAKMVPAALTALASTLNKNLAPELVKRYAKEGREGMLEEIESAIRTSNILVSVPIAVFVAFSVPFYRLWMPSLDAVALSVLSFLSIMAFVPWAGPQAMNNVFTATNNLRFNSISYVIAGLLNFATVYVILRFTDLGVYAIAGVSSVITIIRCFFVIAPYVSRILSVPWYAFYPKAGLSVLSCIISAAVGYTVQWLLPASSWASLIIGVALSAIISWFILAVLTLKGDRRKAMYARLHRQ